MRQGLVFCFRRPCGLLQELADGRCRFTYGTDYLAQGWPPISLTMPLRPEPYESMQLLSFFDGLIPEGWFLQIVIHNWKLDAHDRFGILLACGSDCVGAVSVTPWPELIETGVVS